MAIARSDYGKAFRHICHVAALSRAGKIEGAIDSLVVTALALDPAAGSSVEGLSESLFQQFGLKLSLGAIRSSTGRLLVTGKIRTMNQAGQFVAAADEVAQVTQRAAEAADLEHRVRDEWLSKVEAKLDGLDVTDGRLWQAVQLLMAAVFREHGAQSLELLDPDGAPPAAAAGIYTLVAHALAAAGLPTAQKERDAIELFFNEQSADRSTYLSQLLDGTFSFFALTIDDVTADYLVQGLSPLAVFLDTNFIFGVLRLHVDYFAELSCDVLEMMQGNKFPFTLYYHERTLKELEAALSGAKARLRAAKWPQAISRAAITLSRTNGQLTGIELSYHTLNAERMVDPDIFLSRFDHVERLLQEMGLQLYREPLTRGYSNEQRWELCARYKDYIEKERQRGPKAYETIDHDMSVWVSIQDLRKPGRSALDSGALFLSNDFLLSRFDWQRLRKPHEAGTVVTPTQLIQVLRPFVPATPEFDKQFAAIFALPQFRTSHSGYVTVTGAALGYMAAYSDLPEATAVKILTDEVVLHQLESKDPATIEFREVIDTAIAATNRELLEEKEALQRESEQLRLDRQRQLEEAAARAISDSEDIRRLRASAEGTREREIAAANELQLERTRNQKLESRLTRYVEVFSVGKWVLAAAAAIGAAIAVFVLPDVLGLTWLQQHRNRLGIELSLSLIAMGFVAMVSHRPTRAQAFFAMIVGGVIGLTQIVG